MLTITFPRGRLVLRSLKYIQVRHGYQQTTAKNRCFNTLTWADEYSMQSQYNSCWCLGFFRGQAISRHDIDHVKQANSCLVRAWISTPCTDSMLSQSYKMQTHMFLQINSMGKELTYRSLHQDSGDIAANAMRHSLYINITLDNHFASNRHQAII